MHGYSGFRGDPDPHPIGLKLIAHMEERLPFFAKREQGPRVPLPIDEAELLGADDCGHFPCRFLRGDKTSPNETGGDNSTKQSRENSDRDEHTCMWSDHESSPY
jgi:hypothetical protein